MKLAGVAACVPGNKVQTTLAYENFTKFEVDRIIGNTGVLEKREAEPGTSVSDLCIAAADPLIESLGWDRDSIDAVILITALTDHIMPASAYRAHDLLGLGPRCLVFDMNLGCSGFTHGMIVLDSLMSAGLIKRAILLCGDMSTDKFRPSLRHVQHRSDLANAILFGDAGTATAVSNDGDQVRAIQFGADGSGFKQIIVPGGAGRAAWSPEQFERKTDDEGEERRPVDLILHGPEILTFTMKRVPTLMKDLLGLAGWEVGDVDAFALHQANKFMLDYFQRRMKLPKERVLLSIEEFGNTVSASIPLTMVVRGGEMLAKKTRWAMLGFGVGLSWSGLLMETDGIVTLPLIEV